jgi:signal transduction histidine kinase
MTSEQPWQDPSSDFEVPGFGRQHMPPNYETGEYAIDSPQVVNNLKLSALESLHDGIWLSEIDGTVVYRNAAGAAMERMYWSRGGHVGTLEDVVFNPEILELLRSHGRWAAEYHLSSDGSEGSQITSVAMQMQLLTPAGSDPAGLVFHARDVSREWWREQVLHDRHIELEQAYARLKATQSQLLQSEKMASIGQLAAGVAHEINNPIGYVHSNLGTLQVYLRGLSNLMDAYDRLLAERPEAYADSAAFRDISEIKRQVDYNFVRQDLPQVLVESREGIERVRKIVLDLRDFSHGGQAENEDWVYADIHRGLESTLNIVGSELKYKAEVRKDYGNLPQVECLPAQLNQVFLNLLMNAGQAIKDRGVITITTSQVERGVNIIIADDGIGIDPEHLKRIYDPFFTTKPVGKGTGLGLALSYGIVQKHHGSIEVTSTVGKGSEFRIFLPFSQSDRGLGVVAQGGSLASSLQGVNGSAV